MMTDTERELAARVAPLIAMHEVYVPGMVDTNGRRIADVLDLEGHLRMTCERDTWIARMGGAFAVPDLSDRPTLGAMEGAIGDRVGRFVSTKLVTVTLFDDPVEQYVCGPIVPGNPLGDGRGETHGEAVARAWLAMFGDRR